MNKSIVLVLVIISITFATVEGEERKRGAWRKRVLTPEEKQKFREWRQKYKKTYHNETEEIEAMKKLAENKEEIDKHNELFKKGETTFTRGLWELSDLSPGDKEKFLQGLNLPKTARSLASTPNLPQYPPGQSSVDWRQQGLVGPVEMQGSCGSCWTYSTKGVVEAILRRRNITEPLSPQQMLDCTRSCWGCNGGWPKWALDYLKDNGYAPEKAYPYFEYQRNCAYNRSMSLNEGILNQTYDVWTKGDENWLKNIVSAIGPVSVNMKVEQSFYNYRGGVYFQPNCGKDINHAMLMVGYGTDPKFGDFWLIKNSWGESWGEKGYVRVARNRDNHCNIAHSAVFAT